MSRKNNLKQKIIYSLVCFSLFFQQIGFCQVAGELNITGYLASMHSSISIDKFRPLHLRYFSYDLNSNAFKFLFDKGDFEKGLSPKGTDPEEKFKEETQTLLKYFLIGITLPNSKFWVNLRPDSEDQIIEPELQQTDLGKVLLEADLQLKKDTARYTSPETPEGRVYWNKLYKKAEELFGYETITIPTLTRPWIVPGEIIIRETQDSSFIYKSTLKVMLEQDYLKNSATYNFKDPRMKTLNEYSSQLIRELIIPKLTKEVNISKKYAQLRQVFYSLILSRWFKARFQGKSSFYASLIDSNNLNGLASKQSWSKTKYFKEYQKSFNQGEYNLKEPVYTPTGQVIRSYFSGGIQVPDKLPLIGLVGQGNPYRTNSNLVPGTLGDTLIQEGIDKERPETSSSPLLAPQVEVPRYEYVYDAELGSERVARPGDLYKTFGRRVAVFPSAFIASTIKLFRDIRKLGELERNVVNFRSLIEGTIHYLEQKTQRTEAEAKVLEYLKIVWHVLNTTGLQGNFEEQRRQTRQLGELEQIQIQLRTEKEVKRYLTQHQKTIQYFMPHFAGAVNEAFIAAMADMAKAQGLYGENAVLAAYYRAFQLLVGITFPLSKSEKEPMRSEPRAFRGMAEPVRGQVMPPEESLELGLSFYRAIYQAAKTGELQAEQSYLSDTGPENYAANLTRILTEQDPLILEAITGNVDLKTFIREHKTPLIEKLASDPFVGKTPEETRINIAGVPVDFFETGRPSGFTVLTLIAALDGQIIQKTGNEKTREFVWKIKQQGRAIRQADIPKFLEEGAANLDWVGDLFEGMADRELSGLTPVEKLYKAGGMMLGHAKKMSAQAYALYRMLVASDYILKAEETVKARQRAIVRQAVRTRGAIRETPPQVYVPAMPEVYQVLAQATQDQLLFLRKYFQNLPIGTPPIVTDKLQEKIGQLQKLKTIFENLYSETRNYAGRSVEELVPIRDTFLAGEIFKEWIETGNLSNAKPVAFPAMEIGVFDMDTSFTYQGQVMFMVGGARRGEVSTTDGQRAPFALYDLWRMVKTGGETVTTAEHNLMINNPNNATAYRSEEGIKQAYGAEFVERYDPLSKAASSPVEVDRVMTEIEVEFSSFGSGLYALGESAIKAYLLGVMPLQRAIECLVLSQGEQQIDSARAKGILVAAKLAVKYRLYALTRSAIESYLTGENSDEAAKYINISNPEITKERAKEILQEADELAKAASSPVESFIVTQTIKFATARIKFANSLRGKNLLAISEVQLILDELNKVGELLEENLDRDYQDYDYSARIEEMRRVIGEHLQRLEENNPEAAKQVAEILWNDFLYDSLRLRHGDLLEASPTFKQVYGSWMRTHALPIFSPTEVERVTEEVKREFEEAGGRLGPIGRIAIEEYLKHGLTLPVAIKCLLEDEGIKQIVPDENTAKAILVSAKLASIAVIPAYGIPINTPRYPAGVRVAIRDCLKGIITKEQAEANITRANPRITSEEAKRILQQADELAKAASSPVEVTIGFFYKRAFVGLEPGDDAGRTGIKGEFRDGKLISVDRKTINQILDEIEAEIKQAAGQLHAGWVVTHPLLKKKGDYHERVLEIILRNGGLDSEPREWFIDKLASHLGIDKDVVRRGMAIAEKRYSEEYRILGAGERKFLTIYPSDMGLQDDDHDIFGPGATVVVTEIATVRGQPPRRTPTFEGVLEEPGIKLGKSIMFKGVEFPIVETVGDIKRTGADTLEIHTMRSRFRVTRTSSPASVSPGGIDFRVMNIVTQPLVANPNLKLPQLANLAEINLDKEFQQLQNMLSARIIPSGERIKEYLAACKQKGEWDSRIADIISCLVEICRLEEDNVSETPLEIKEALIIADSVNLGS